MGVGQAGINPAAIETHLDTLSDMSRVLEKREREVLEAMITFAGDFDVTIGVPETSRQRWLAEVANTRVGDRCGCGECPSIELEDVVRGAPSIKRYRFVLSAATTDALILLFIDDGQLCYLELARIDLNSSGTTEFPPVQSLDFTR